MNILPSLPLWLAGAVLAALCFLGSEIGQRVHFFLAKRRPPADEQIRIDIEGFIIGSVFGLFAFMIGFTFSIAIDRFDTRRVLVSEEANAIRTSFYQASLLDDRDRIPLQNVLRAYAHTRISPEGLSDRKRKAQLERSLAIRNQIWPITRSSVLPYRDTDLGVSIGESVNEVLSVGSRRQNAGTAFIPDTVMNALLLYLLGSSTLLGYLTAQQPYRLRAASSLLFVLMALAIVLVLDLDRPRSGSIKISQKPMEDLVATLDRAALPSPTSQQGAR